MNLLTSGHSAYANKVHRKGRQDTSRGNKFTKLIREITVSARLGLPDPQYNARLRSAIHAARKENLPKDRIESAIKVATRSGPGENYDEVDYEAYGPGGSAFIIRAQTNNRNKTSAAVRYIFSKRGGNVGKTGSVSHLFDHVGLIVYKSEGKKFDDFFELATELEALNVEEGKTGEYIITCDTKDFGKVRDGFYAKHGEPELARLSWQAKNLIEIKDKALSEKLSNLVDALEEDDDVQYVEDNFTLLDSDKED